MSEEQKLTEQEMNRRNKLEKYMERGIDPFGQAYERTHFSTEIRALVAGKSHDEVLAMDLHVAIAGRIMFIRKMGKASFFSIQDLKGKMQVELLYVSIKA